MTAHEFIDQLFSRPPFGLPSNIRRITCAQLDLLRRLIDEDEEGGAVDQGIGPGFTWMPSGRNKYIIAEDPGSGKYRLTRLANIVPSAMGRLF